VVLVCKSVMMLLSVQSATILLLHRACPTVSVKFYVASKSMVPMELVERSATIWWITFVATTQFLESMIQPILVSTTPHRAALLSALPLPQPPIALLPTRFAMMSPWDRPATILQFIRVQPEAVERFFVVSRSMVPMELVERSATIWSIMCAAIMRFMELMIQTIHAPAATPRLQDALRPVQPPLRSLTAPQKTRFAMMSPLVLLVMILQFTLASVEVVGWFCADSKNMVPMELVGQFVMIWSSTFAAITSSGMPAILLQPKHVAQLLLPQVRR